MFKQRISLFFKTVGPARYLSQLDFLRHFERAVRRAKLPVRMSEGFNPRPRFSFPLARPVGVESRRELCEIELSRPVDPNAVREALNRELVAGISVTDASFGAPHDKRRVDAVRYVFRFRRELDARSLAIDDFLSAESVPVRRRKSEQTVDARPLIRELSLEGDTLTALVAVTPTGTLRPAEILEAVGFTTTDRADAVEITREIVADESGPKKIARRERPARVHVRPTRRYRRR